MKRACLVLAGWCLAAGAAAHQASDSHLDVRAAAAAAGRLEVRWDIALRDLDAALDLDADRDGAIDWGEGRRRQGDIAALAWSRLDITAGRPCESLRAADPALAIARRGELAYVVLQRAYRCPAGPRRLDYRLFAGSDAGHRGILVWRPATGEAVTRVLDPRGPGVALAGAGALSPAATAGSFVAEGIRHILAGADHLLFLLALLLGAVMVREGRAWRAAPSLRPALVATIAIVTAFTVAHSITLALAVLGVVTAPAAWIEPAIALSVAVAALDNLRPVLPGPRWAAAFAFGLLHGFGFAGAMAELSLPDASLGWALAGFNAGVELGQLAVVALFFPLAYRLRHARAYRALGLQGASAAIGVLAAAWCVERLLGIPLLPALPS